MSDNDLAGQWIYIQAVRLLEPSFRLYNLISLMKITSAI